MRARVRVTTSVMESVTTLLEEEEEAKELELRLIEEREPPNHTPSDELFAVVFGKCNPDEIIRKIEAYLNLYNQGTTLPYATTSSSGAFTGILGPDFEFKKALKLADDNMYIAKNRKRAGIIS